MDFVDLFFLNRHVTWFCLSSSFDFNAKKKQIHDMCDLQAKNVTRGVLGVIYLHHMWRKLELSNMNGCMFCFFCVSVFFPSHVGSLDGLSICTYIHTYIHTSIHTYIYMYLNMHMYLFMYVNLTLTLLSHTYYS